MAERGDLASEDVAVIADAIEGGPGWQTVARRLRDSGRESLTRLATAFEYDLVDVEHESRRAAVGVYGPVVEFSDGDAHPRRLGDVEATTWAFWLSVREVFPDPLVRARLDDLRYVDGGPACHAQGRSAAENLLTLGSEMEGWEPLDRVECLSRSLEISTELNDRAGRQSATDAAVAYADELLTVQPYPGPPLRLIRAVARLKPKDRPEGLDDLVDRAVARFAGEPVADRALEVAESAATKPGRKRELRRRRLQGRRDGAAALHGLAKANALQRAADLARQYGFADDAAALLRELQDLPADDREFERFGAEIELPTKALDAEIASVAGAGAAGFEDALRRIGTYGPPGGSDGDLDQELDEQDREFRLTSLMSHSVMAPGSSAPVYIATSPESKRRLARGQRRTLAVQLTANVLIAPMLDTVESAHGRPSHASLSALFATELIGPTRGERIARAVELFWDEAYDESAHVLVPRIESILRDVARTSGITVVKPVVRDGEYAGVVSLNVALGKLRQVYDDAPWLCYLQAVLADPLSMNLRNAIAHGLVDQVDRVGAATLIQAACHLALWRPATGGVA